MLEGRHSTGVSDVRVRAAFEQKLNDVFFLESRGDFGAKHASCVSVRIRGIYIRSGIERLPHRLDVVLMSCCKELIIQLAFFRVDRNRCGDRVLESRVKGSEARSNARTDGEAISSRTQRA